MNKAALIGGIILVVVLAAAIPAGIYLATHPQIFQSQAQSTGTTVPPTPSPLPSGGGAGGACQTPAVPANIQINYPYETGSQVSFTQASCTWESVTGAATYNLLITEVDSNTVIKTESVSSSTTSTVFNVTQNKTYRCDVTAVNSCGQQGGTGTVSLLCAVEGVIATATPSASATPPAASTPPPATPAPTPLACGYGPCNSGTGCGAGMTCVTAINGQSYCAMSAYANNCQKNPTLNNCCSAPVSTPLPQAGDSDSMLWLVAMGTVFLLLGGVMLRFGGKRR